MVKLKSVEKKLKTTPYVPSSDDPKAELRRLVQEHVALTRNAVAIESMASDKTRREDFTDANGEVHPAGETIACRLPVDAQELLKSVTVVGLRKHADSLERAMLKELKKLPIWFEFLASVRGCGPVVAAYLIAMVDFRRCEKPSALKRFCGFGVTHEADGTSHRDRKTKGQKLNYCAELKTRLWQMFSLGIRMSQGKSHSKYLEIWNQKKQTLLLIRGPGTTDNKSKGWCDATSRRKATDVFLEDLYIVGRAIEGLPVWPSWYAKAMGYEHGGKVAVLQPRLLDLSDALVMVGAGKPEAVAAE